MREFMDRENFETCPYCGGEGSNEVSNPQRDDPYFAVVVKCEECNGSGWICTVLEEAPDPMRGVEFPFAENH